MRKRIYLMRPNIGTEEIREIQKVLHSKFLTEGKVTAEFEKRIATYVHSKYAIATTSATTALHTAFEALNVKNKRVLVSDFTFPATALSIIQSGGIPVLVDVDKHRMNVTRGIIENSMKKNDSIICPVSLFGNSLDMDFYRLKKNGFSIVEDAATNLGTKVGEKFVGQLADVTCFSFHPRKIITTGEGGMITTDNKELNEKMRSFKMFGKIGNEFVNLGTNYKLSDIQSALGLCQLKKLDKIIKSRIKKAKIYNEFISKINYIEPQEQTPNSLHTYQSYTCIILKPKARDKVIKKLALNNIESQIGTYALHCLPVFKKYSSNELANSEFLYKNSISLPLHEELFISEQESICKLIKEILND